MLRLVLLILSTFAVSSFTTPRPPPPTTATSTQLHGTYKKVFVAGASRGVGRIVVEKLSKRFASDATTQVVAFVRDPTMVDELDQLPGVEAVVGDAFVQKDVENAMDGCDAAITTLGGSSSAPPSPDGGNSKRVDYEGNNNVIESAGILGVTRILLVTSIGCGNSKQAAPPSVFEVLKDVLASKEKAENVLLKYYTNSNWTIIRPGGLKSEPGTGKAILTEDNTAIGSIHREDVADLILRAMDSPKTERKVLSAIDPSITSSVVAEGRGEDIKAFALV